MVTASSSQRWTLFGLFFGSGAASLMCEVVWFKQLSLVLGSSAWAAAVVVACFFSGLGIGGWLAGRLAERSVRLVRLYAGLEALLAVVSAGITYVLASWNTVYLLGLVGGAVICARYLAPDR